MWASSILLYTVIAGLTVFVAVSFLFQVRKLHHPSPGSASRSKKFPQMWQTMKMSIDANIVTSLNSWGASHQSLVHLFSNDFVYISILLTGLWLVVETLRAHPSSKWRAPSISGLINNGLLIIILPVALTIFVSEVISKLYARDRPFVAVPGIKLLVPHSADGGMPSHHIAFMAALTASIYFYDKRTAALIGILALFSALGRVTAGIHYPSDIIAGVGVGIFVVYIYRRLIVRFFTPTVLDVKL